MGFLQNLRDRFITQPIAKQLIAQMGKADEPMAWGVPLGFNSAMGDNNKRMTTSTVEMSILRSLSVQHETTRAAINTRKRQITQLDFDIVDIQNDVDPMATADEQEQVRQMILHIGGDGVRFRQLLDQLIEDLLVIDACVFYKQRDRSGKLLKIIPIDATTIKLRVDQSGTRPMPPEPAFEQWINGKKITGDLTTNDMTYEVMNPRTNSPYGLSPIESLIISLDGSMRAMLYNIHYLSDNNIPAGFVNVPDGWTVAQIKEYSEWFDAKVSGSKATSKIHFIPSGATYAATSKPADFQFKDFFDLLDRRICMLFDIQPQELGLSLQQYKENADAQERTQIRKGIKPLAHFFEEIFSDIIQLEFGFPHLAFKFVGVDGRYTNEDIKQLVPFGILSVDEVRNDRGLTKIGVGNLIIAGQTIQPIGDTTTVSGTPLNSEPEDEAPDTTPSAAKLAKIAGEIGLNRLEKTKTFKDFNKKMATALRKQINPFTEESEIDKILGAEKAASSTVENKTNPPSLKIVFSNQSINDFLKWAAQEGGQQAQDQLGINGTFEMNSDTFDSLLGDRANYLIDSVDTTTKDWLVNQISNGHDEGLTNAEIAQGIADDMPDFTQARADTIVNTETANAVGEGQLQIYRDQGIEEKEWHTSEDESVCPICEPLDGEIEKLDDNFSSGDDHEPAHPNCRCWTEAVVPDVG